MKTLKKQSLSSLPPSFLASAASASSHPRNPMKKFRRRIAIFCLVWISIAAFGLQSIAQTSEQASSPLHATASTETQLVASQALLAAAESKMISKDETVYFTLRPDGGVDTISVVNFLQVPAAGDYIDYGPYKAIKSLSLNIDPVLSGNRITWSLPAMDQGFYYQGTLENRESPFIFHIEYSLDGNVLPASALIGKSGKVEIKITVDSNPTVAAYFKSNYLCQIQVPLSLEKVKNISAPDAQTVMVGKTATLAYVVLPGKSSAYTVTFDASVFEMNAITISSLPFSAGSYLGIDPAAIKDGIQQLIAGSGSLVSGTKDLKAGLRQLSEGTILLANSSALLANGQKEIGSGLSGYQSGLLALSGNMTQFSQGLAMLATNSAGLTQGYSSLSTGVIALLDSISPLLLSLPVEQQTLYSLQFAALKEQLNAYGVALNNYSGAIAQISASANELAGGLFSLSSQGNSLVTGMNQLSQGMGSLHQGISELSSKTADLPNQVEKLIQGQILLTSGIKDATGLLDTFTSSEKTTSPVSFVDSSVSVHSVQFVMTIPEQKMAAVAAPNGTATVKKTFWQRLADLFRKQE